MLRWFIVLASLLLFINLAAGQCCSVQWYYGSENGTPLTTICQGGVPIPDGYPIKIMWDANSNGPDIADVPAPLCTDPPNCDLGPPGTANYNTMFFNGTAGYGALGYFYTETAFSSSGSLPNPPRFYLRVYEGDGVTPLWTTIVYTVVSGPQTYFIPQGDWSCGTGSPQCVVIGEHE